VIWVKGNHDAEANADAAHHLAPNVNFVPHYDEFPLRVRHGHENCLFNAPDPTGREFPLGYFISRFVATAAARGMAEVGMNFRTIWKSGPKLVALLEHGALVDCVFDVVRNAAGIKLEDRVIMPNGSTVEVSDVRATYQNLIAEWNQHKGNAMEAVLCEWDPFYDLPVNKPYLNINGHSHDHKYSSLITGGVYANLGSWCARDAHFAKTWLENAGQVNETLRAELFKWEPGVGAQSASTRASILTGGR
jgi:UDP-2,3-diacylglucosamine pyrophosphatase LpxH